MKDSLSYVTGGLLLVLDAKIVSTCPLVRKGNGLYGELIVGHLLNTPLLNWVGSADIAAGLALRLTLAHAEMAMAERTVKATVAGDKKACSIWGN